MFGFIWDLKSEIDGLEGRKERKEKFQTVLCYYTSNLLKMCLLRKVYVFIIQ